jgi:lysophospholipase L1-like esterase
VLLLTPLLVAGCQSATRQPTSAASARPAAAATVRAVVVGDSITEADSPDFDAGDIGQGSWAWWADGNGLDVLGGWAHAGATTADALAEVQPMSADVLVLMAGNNDIDWEVPTPKVLEHLVAIATQVGVPRVVLSAVAPEDGLGPEVADLNAALVDLAAQEGWQFVDPMTEVRASDGDYRTGTSLDGVHPTEEASATIGVALHEAILHPSADAADVGPAEQTG